jgi:hypothetical protein
VWFASVNPLLCSLEQSLDGIVRCVVLRFNLNSGISFDGPQLRNSAGEKAATHLYENDHEVIANAA